MGRGQTRFSGEEELDLLVRACEPFERARRLVENGPLAWRVLKRVCCLPWLWPLWLLKDALRLHAAACGPQGQDPFWAEICLLINETKRRSRKTLNVDAMVAVMILAYVLLPPIPTPMSTTTATSTLTPTMSLPTLIAIAAPLVTVTATTVPTPTPTSMATATPTQSPPPVSAYRLLVIIDKTYDVPPAGSITIEAKAGSTIRIGISLEDETGQRVPPGQATYQWRFSPPDPENARRVGRLNADLNYTVPTDRRGQLITIDVEAAGYRRTIVIQIIIQ